MNVSYPDNSRRISYPYDSDFMVYPCGRCLLEKKQKSDNTVWAMATYIWRDSAITLMNIETYGMG